MIVRVRRFAVAKHLAQADFLCLDLPADATVGLLRRRLAGGTSQWVQPGMPPIGEESKSS